MNKRFYHIAVSLSIIAIDVIPSFQDIYAVGVADQNPWPFQLHS